MNKDINSLINEVIEVEKKGMLEKINKEIEYLNNREHDYDIGISTGLKLAKDIILDNQKEHQYIHSCKTCLKKNKCLDNNGYVLTCEYYHKDNDYQPTKTKGDLVRESNDSLVEWIFERELSIFNTTFDRERLLKRLNQPVEDK